MGVRSFTFLHLVLAAPFASLMLGGCELRPGHAPRANATEPPTALLAAIRAGNRDLVSDLLERGADVNAPDDAGTTPLMQAALNADLPMVELLLARGADPRFEAANGASALLRAVHDPAKVKLLLQHGAPVRPNSVVLAALVPGSAQTVRLLLEHGGDANAAIGGFTALMAAASSGDLDTVSRLLEHGAQVNAQRDDGTTALYCAVEFRNEAIVERLLDRGADPNIVHQITNPTYDVETPALQAAWLGEASILERLLAHGAKVNIQGGSFERTPLLCAATTGNAEVVRLLLAHAANVEAQDWAGHTPLYWAQRRGSAAVIKLLEQAGAHSPSQAGKSPDPARGGKSVAPRTVRAAVAAPLPLLQRSGVQFTQRKQCVSCHQQAAVALVVSLARGRGIPVDEELASREHAHILAHLESNREKLLHGNGIDPALAAWTLWSFAAEGQEPNEVTDSLVHFLAVLQRKAGNWQTTVYRPPHDASHFTYTALAVRGLKRYAPDGRRQEIEERIARARAWLLATRAPETEDKALRLLGLRWAEAGDQPIQQAAAELLGEQRADGGWAQLSSLPSDAYATGEVLFALQEGGGIAVTHPAYERGVQFLLRTQCDDGTWFVPTRSFPLIEPFNSGFPHGRSQFISTAGTCWASMALALTIPGKEYDTAAAGKQRQPGTYP
jgi:ankyrin repeat protein